MDMEYLAFRQTAVTLVLALLGLAFGSFFALLAHRLPRKIPHHAPSSHCPHCGTRLRARDTIPVLSWLFAKGRCRVCCATISIRYPLLESMTCIVFATTGWRVSGLGWSNSATTLAVTVELAFLSSLLIASLVDMETGLLPDRITLGGLVCSLILPFLMLRPPGLPGTVLDAVWGGAVGAGAGVGIRLIGRVACASTLARQQKNDATIDAAFGWGDVKALAFCGAFLGWRNVFPLVLVASVSSLIIGGWMYFRRDEPRGPLPAIPFGPFVAIGAWAALAVDWSWLEW